MTYDPAVAHSASFERRRVLLERLREGRHGLDWCLAHTEVMDSIVAELSGHLMPRGSEPVAVIATGGYGRRELAPYSDIDVAIVPVDESAPELEVIVRDLFQALHTVFQDILKLDIGYSFRLITDAPGLDATSRTGLLDARLVCGSRAAFESLLKALRETLPTGQFLLAKMAEREAAYQKHHDTPLVVEPHLKEGAGGLRDFQCAGWIAEAIGGKPFRPDRAYDEVIAARNALHHVAGKRQDTLTKQRQAELAELWKRHPLEMMSDISQDMNSLHSLYGETVRSLRESRFRVSPGVQAMKGEARVTREATLSEAAVGIAVATALGLSTPESDTAAGPVIDGGEALYAISTGEKTLRHLDRAGLLEQLIPELTRCRTLMPNDTAHRFTVFEHTLRVVRHLDQPPRGFLHELYSSLTSRDLLYLAALLHDVGKAISGRRHSETGAEISEEVCRRWGLSDRARAAVSWLVRNHLLLSEFLRMRDVMNPTTAHELAAEVQTQERLDLLTLLTWADVNSVNEHAWTAAQDQLLKTLHERTSEVLALARPAAPDPALYRKRLIRELKDLEVPESELRAFVESMPAHYLVSTPTQLVKVHVELVRRALDDRPTVELYNQPEIGSTDVTVCCLDRPGLLSRLLGVIYAFDLAVHGIRASTTRTAIPVALDVFTVSFAGNPVPPATAEAFAYSLKQVISGEQTADNLLLAMGKEPDRKQEVFTYRFLPGNPGILEIQAPRGRGMAYRFSRLITARGWNIVAARVGQWAGRGTAAFYLEGHDRPLTAEEVQAALESHVAR